jgi:hypothetical protein
MQRALLRGQSGQKVSVLIVALGTLPGFVLFRL